MFLIYVLQVFLVPYQSMNYYARKADKTRLRFLILTLVYFAFNITWLSLLQSLSFDTWKEIPSIGYLGVIMISCTYYYISKESEINNSKNSTIVLLLLLSTMYALQHISKVHLSSDISFYTTIISSIGIQVIAIIYGVKLVRPVLKTRITKGSISPIYLATLLAVFIYCFSPLFFYLISNASIEIIIVNAPFVVISLAYLSHDVKQQKSEGKVMHPRLINDTLNGRYERIEDDAWLIAEYSELNRKERNKKIAELLKEFDLTDKQLEVAIMVLNGLTTKHIAEEINRSEENVRWHVMNISEKVGVSGVGGIRKKFHEIYYSRKKK